MTVSPRQVIKAVIPAGSERSRRTSWCALRQQPSSSCSAPRYSGQLPAGRRLVARSTKVSPRVMRGAIKARSPRSAEHGAVKTAHGEIAILGGGAYSRRLGNINSSSFRGFFYFTYQCTLKR